MRARIRTTDGFGRVARQARLDQQLSQAELAERAGVTRQWLIRFEQGRSDVSLAKTMDVFTALDLVVGVTDRSVPAEAVIDREPPIMRIDHAPPASLTKHRDLLDRLATDDYDELRAEFDARRRAATS